VSSMASSRWLLLAREGEQECGQSVQLTSGSGKEEGREVLGSVLGLRGHH
jgi:hypothetical protein